MLRYLKQLSPKCRKPKEVPVTDADTAWLVTSTLQVVQYLRPHCLWHNSQKACGPQLGLCGHFLMTSLSGSVLPIKSRSGIRTKQANANGSKNNTGRTHALIWARFARYAPDCHRNGAERSKGPSWLKLRSYLWQKVVICCSSFPRHGTGARI